MHPKTKSLTIVLLITAVFLLGVRISNLLSGDRSASAIPSPTPVANLQLPGTPKLAYINTYCGVSLDYPPDFTVTESTNAAHLTQKGTNETIDVACGKDLPKPPLPKDKIETATVAGQLATIYHDKLAKDGSPVDVIIFTHPKTKLEIALFGFGEMYNSLLKSVRLIQ